LPCQLTVSHSCSRGIEEHGPGLQPSAFRLLSERLPVAAEPRQLEAFEQQRHGPLSHRLRAGTRGGGGHRRPAGVGESTRSGRVA